MKRTTIWIAAAAMLLAVFSSFTCKKADVETKTLTVIVSTGVTGSPAAGEHTLEVGQDQAYAYTLDAGYEKLTVLLDGNAIAASGKFTVSGNHVLQAYSNDNLTHKLIVTKADGVSGTPAAGTYWHLKGTQLPYSYSLAAGYDRLGVTLDEKTIASSGTLTISADHVLRATASRKYDVQGAWILSESYNDGSSFTVTLTFSGSNTSGTVTDSQGGIGTYDYLDDTLDFTLVFPEVTYLYEDGEFSSETTVSGTCKRYQNADNTVSGTWTATRSAGTAAVPRASSGAKGKARKTQ